MMKNGRVWINLFLVDFNDEISGFNGFKQFKQFQTVMVGYVTLVYSLINSQVFHFSLNSQFQLVQSSGVHNELP